MKIAVIGAGAIGSLVAGFLTRAGQHCALVGKKDQVAAIRQDGLLIRQSDRKERVSLEVMERLNRPFDLVIFAVKTLDLEQSFQMNHRFLETGLILTCQNGVQADNLLGFHFEQEQMISSIVMFGATYAQPGEVIYNSPGDWIIGRPYGPNDPTVQKVAEVLRRGFEVIVTPDILGMKWLKLFINFNNCIPALLGRSMQETFADPDFCLLSIRLLKEGVDIVQKAGIPLISLPQFPVERVLELAALPEDQSVATMHKTLAGLSGEPVYGSILQSIQRGKSSEIDFINGEVIEVAAARHWKAPLNRRVVDLVHQVERTGKFFSAQQIKKEFALLA